MTNGFAIIFLFFIVVVITAALFVGWMVYSITRVVVGGTVHLLFGSRRRREPRALPANLVHCARPGCGALNPATARFCRRCGAQLPAPHQVVVRRAAVW